MSFRDEPMSMKKSSDWFIIVERQPITLKSINSIRRTVLWAD